MKRHIFIALTMSVTLLVLAGCTYVYDNVTDRGAENYQGYTTVATVEEVTGDWPEEGEEEIWCLFRSSVVIDGGSDRYALQISSGADGFESPLYENLDSANNVFDVSAANISEGSLYYRVKARPTGGDWPEGWSETVSFTAVSGVDETGLDPADGGFTPDTTPALDWPDITGAVSYEVEYSTTEAALDGSGAIPTTSSGHPIPDTDTFTYGETCCWRVRAVNADGIAGAWSGVYSFVVSHIDMVSVTGGTFDMGSTSGYSDEEPVHSVTVSGFSISTTEVTQGLYEEVMGSNPASSFGVGDTYPVYNVSWYDAVDFCNALSDLEGFDRCYTVNGTDVTCDFTRNGYRLPTEAEWEFAARGGNASNWYTYAGSDTVGDVAWYWYNSNSATHPVGTKAPNELGLYDMSGNLWEWCWDWYDAYYYDVSPSSGPAGPSSGSYRVKRGGSWHYIAAYCRSASRLYGSPSYGISSIGFRVARR